ncbi:MAG: alpha/beta hydrolase [Dehalococcoidia bacterium]|nr:alpha/beta hydrolase [Dehalococcoidia bacterium]
MHYATAGEGEVVLLLHGFPESWYSWRHQIAALAQQYRVIAPDLRGYNETEKQGPYDTDTLQADVLALLDHADASAAHIAGHDWGGAVAWLLAIQHPEHVRSLVVCNIPHPALFQRSLRRNPRQMLRSWYILFFQLPWLPERVFAARRYHLLARMLINDCRPGTFTREDVTEMLAGWRRNGLGGGFNWYRALLRHPRRLPKPVPKVIAPTLMIWGEDDSALGKELTLGTEEYVEDFELTFLPNTSHWVQQEEPRKVTELILAHLAKATIGG